MSGRIRPGVLPFAALCAWSLASASMPGRAVAQEADSLRHYRLSEIVVGESAPRRSETAAVRRVPLAEIARSDAQSVASVARLVPAAHLQTNSRGETLVYLRGAGERQVAIYLDGALVNVPWDNRVDLALLPSGMLGSIGVAHGASSVLYGTNTVGGVLLLSSRTLDRPGSLSEAVFSGGSAGYRRAEMLHLSDSGRRSLLVAAGYGAIDGQPVPAGAKLPFEASRGLRTNTDRRLSSLFVRGATTRGTTVFTASVLHADGRQGVAPEGHLDPAEGAVRYWRYPVWRMTLGTVGLQRPVGADGALRGTTWLSRFEQRIDQYGSVAYERLDAREDGLDWTAGTRWSVDRRVGVGTVVAAATGTYSRHLQDDSERDGTALGPAVRTSYSQSAWSLGAEYRAPVSGSMRSALGAGLEGIATPETGDKPARGAQSSWTMSATGVFDVSQDASIRVAAGRKLRFPTPRELFGTAIGRFLPDDGLEPESAWTADAAWVRSFDEAEIEVTGFVRRTFDTIDQENVLVDGRRLRRRINLDGSVAAGVEIAGRLEPREGLELEGHATVQHGRIYGVEGRTRPVEKPGLLGTAIATWRLRRGLELSTQATVTGRAWGLGEDNAEVALRTSVVTDFRVAWRRLLPGSAVFVEAFARLDNAFDALSLPQLGLPAPGRTGKAGLSLSF